MIMKHVFGNFHNSYVLSFGNSILLRIVGNYQCPLNSSILVERNDLLRYDMYPPPLLDLNVLILIPVAFSKCALNS